MKLSLTAALILITVICAWSADISVNLTTDRKEYKTGDTAILILTAKIPDKYHLYGNPLGPGIGRPFTITLEEPKGVNAVELLKMPAKKYQPQIGDYVWAYEKSAVFFLKTVVTGTGSVSGKLILDCLICYTACTPITKEIPFSLTVNPNGNQKMFASSPAMQTVYTGAEKMKLQYAEAPVGVSETLDESAITGIDLSVLDKKKTESDYAWTFSPVESKSFFNIFIALLFAFIAGMILNVMPCVLPVIGIKILSFSEGRKESRSRTILHSLVFSAGMISLFPILASLAAWAGYSWGQQFQNPWILAGIIAVIFFFALGMFDVYTLLVPSSISNLERKSAGKGLAGDFFKGMFTTVLATPCSGPFLGATLAWTLTQKPVVIYTVFFAIGAGMAFPYVLLAACTGLMKLMPKPGKWMNDFKHVMGFLLFGFAVYLMLGLPRDMILPLIGMCVAFSFAIGAYGRFAPFGSSWTKKIAAAIITLAIIGTGVYLNFAVLYSRTSEKAVTQAGKNGTEKWELFTPELLRKAEKEGRNVVVDFTATWCINCQYNKIAVLHSPEIGKLIDRKNVVRLKADLTGDNPGAQSLLHHLGSRSVPFLAIFNKADFNRPVIMRDVLNKKRVARALTKLPE